MASTTSVTCAASAVHSSLCSRASRASLPSTTGVSFCFNTSSVKGLRVSTPSGRRTSVERGFKRLSIRAEDDELVAVAPVPPVPPPSASPVVKKKAKVSVLQRKQRVMLRFLWLEKNIGIALDQVVAGHGIIPLSPYFFWPRKDAWEELKAKLDSKKWISRKRTIILLNQATDIINLWQQNATNTL